MWAPAAWGVALCRRHEVVQTCNITPGILKAQRDPQEHGGPHPRFYQVIEEYVDAYFQRLSWRLAGGSPRELVLTGRELDTIASLCGAAEENGAFRIPRDALEGLYETIKNLPAGIIADQAAIPEETADQLLPMLVIYQRMMDFAMAPAILSPRLRLMDILARQMLLPAEKARFEAQERNGALSCAREMCARRGMDLAHAERYGNTRCFCSKSSKGSTASAARNGSCSNVRLFCTRPDTVSMRKTPPLPPMT